MKLHYKDFILTAVATGLMLPALAQTSTPAAKSATINQRKENHRTALAMAFRVAN